MTYRRLGLAALIVSAVRSAVADPEQQEQLDRQDAQITAVRGAMDSLSERLESVSTAVAQNGTLDEGQTADLDGIKAELAELADALTGPKDDTSDNGVIGEVQTAPVVVDPATDVSTSPTADAAIENAPADVEIPEPIAVDPAPEGAQD